MTLRARGARGGGGHSNRSRRLPSTGFLTTNSPAWTVRDGKRLGPQASGSSRGNLHWDHLEKEELSLTSDTLDPLERDRKLGHP